VKILLTNDDGFDADGLQQLHAVLSRSHECFIVAPDRGRSCCGHAVTTSETIAIQRRNPRGWTVDGTPADAVRIGLLWLDIQPDLVVSGLNQGGNLGVDIAYSGTVAAAREARLLGFRSIAISQYMRRDVDRDWSINAARAAHVIEQDGFWSINLPAIAKEVTTHSFPITRCNPERAMLPVQYEMQSGSHDSEHSVLYRSNYQSRERTEATDVHWCFSGHATLSWLKCAPFGKCDPNIA
jgi:5'-nucleotidase